MERVLYSPDPSVNHMFETILLPELWHFLLLMVQSKVQSDELFEQALTEDVILLRLYTSICNIL